MDIFQAIILGIVQGVTEYLPISSSAHLILLPWFFKWQDPGLAFDIVLHFGTLLAVLIFFWRQWLGIFFGFFKLVFGQKKWGENPDGRLAIYLFLATIPGAVIGWFFSNAAETIFRSPVLIASVLFIFSLVLWLADKEGSENSKNISQTKARKSFLIGLTQAVAIVPGVSRSGATISAGLFLGLDKKSAAKFSFLLAAPIIFGANVFKMAEILQAGFNGAFWVGIISAALSGFVAIWFLLKFVERRSYKIFVWYRILLALAIVTIYFL
ncbi:MAG: undecaprenyl-diphosphatase UppP [Candidatus Portnoybacteria bacterium]|nr:undecaprenyl-diphosphatase UppP [Candidatus Portnoybacteria bacterium]